MAGMKDMKMEFSLLELGLDSFSQGVFDARRVRIPPPNNFFPLFILAEKGGFEPPIPLPVCQISNLVPSATRPPLRFIHRPTKSAYE